MTRRRRWRPEGDVGPRPVGDSLRAVVARLPAPERVLPAPVVTDWGDIVGAVLAPHVRPLRVGGGVLVVAADHAVWAVRARVAARGILARAADRGVAATRLEVVVRAP